MTDENFSYIPEEAPIKRRRGRPPYEPTDFDRDYVKRMSSFGIPTPRIAKIVGIDEKTLQKHFPDELENATDELVARVATNMASIAEGDSPQAVSAGKYLLAVRGKWLETSRTELTGANGGPISLDMGSWTDEQIAAFIAANEGKK